jgi:hypothetical protein
MVEKDLIERIRRVLVARTEAWLDAWLDRAEARSGPALLARALAEVDAAIVELQHAAGKAVARRHTALRRMYELDARHGALAAAAEEALARGDDGDARACFAEQLDVEAQLPALRDAVADADADREKLEGLLQALVARRRELRQAVSTAHAAPVGGLVGGPLDAAARATAAELGVDRALAMNGRGDPKTSADAATEIERRLRHARARANEDRHV